MIVRTIPVGDLEALVDEDDFALVSAFNWYKSTCGRRTTYAQSGCRDKLKSMHRLILGAPKGMQVDHINGNGLDNRRSNLRLCTNRENQMNSGPRTGRFKGVSPTQNGTFRAMIHVSGRQIRLGTFKSEEEAALAYNVVAREHFGEFAWLNEVQQ